MMFSNPPPSTRGPTAPRPNYTPQVTQQRPSKEVRIDNTPLPQQPSEPQGETLPQVYFSFNHLCCRKVILSDCVIKMIFTFQKELT